MNTNDSTNAAGASSDSTQSICSTLREYRSVAYRKGFKAGAENSEWVNPYCEGDDDHADWETGWENGTDSSL